MAITVTSTIPTDPGGDVAIICELELTENVALAEPNFTAVTPEKLEPKRVTVVPPFTVPKAGVIPATVGATAV